MRECIHKGKFTCYCHGLNGRKIKRCPSNTTKDCKIRDTRYKEPYKIEEDYNPSWEEILEIIKKEKI